MTSFMLLSYSSEDKDAGRKDKSQQPHVVPARPSTPEEPGGPRVESETSIKASGLPLKPEPGPQVTAQQEGGDEEKPACEVEKHLWATVEEKQGSEKDGRQQEEEEGGVTGG